MPYGPKATGLPIRDGVKRRDFVAGWNPYFDNAQKTAEPWLLHDFDKDFYGRSSG